LKYSEIFSFCVACDPHSLLLLSLKI